MNKKTGEVAETNLYWIGSKPISKHGKGSDDDETSTRWLKCERKRECHTSDVTCDLRPRMRQSPPFHN